MAFFVLTLLSHFIDGLEVALLATSPGHILIEGVLLPRGTPLPSDVHSYDNSGVKLLQ